MKTNEILMSLDNEDFLNKIYQFAYYRCNTSFEAEDLCSDIILAVLKAVQSEKEIESFYAFVWTVARRVYADFCEKRKRLNQNISIENSELVLSARENEIDTLIEHTADREQIKKIFNEISFLSKLYREVMVMYYIDEMNVKGIAKKLGISESTVKQRLFSARNTVRKEVETMNDRNLSLKPIKFEYLNTGRVVGNTPIPVAERMLSQNLIYLCRNKAKTAKELSDELCVPTPYIEEELDIQCKGQNGAYGTIRKLSNGKYIANIPVADYEVYEEGARIFRKYIPEFCAELKAAFEKQKGKILSFPYLNRQDDPSFILWTLIIRLSWKFLIPIISLIDEKYFSDVTPVARGYASAAIAHKADTVVHLDVYGNDGINANSLLNYKTVSLTHMYGKYIGRQFSAGHNISTDQKLLMLIRSIGGLPLSELTENEKEIAAKAIECGYIRKNGNIIEPKVITIEKKNADDFEKLADDILNTDSPVTNKIAKELSDLIRKHIPKHLLDEYQTYMLITNAEATTIFIEEAVKYGLLKVPENKLCAEGMMMIVEK